MAKMHVSLFLLAAIGCFLTGQVGAMTHIVGKSFGWRSPTDMSFYQTWAESRNFMAGDKLAFLFTSGLHNVLEVEKEDFDGCTQKHVIKTYKTGPTILQVNEPGDHYFICGLRNHCESGVKLSIRVSGGGGDVSSAAADSVRHFRVLSGLVVVLLVLLM